MNFLPLFFLIHHHLPLVLDPSLLVLFEFAEYDSVSLLGYPSVPKSDEIFGGVTFSNPVLVPAALFDRAVGQRSIDFPSRFKFNKLKKFRKNRIL
jgi:hypothetical protein